MPFRTVVVSMKPKPGMMNEVFLPPCDKCHQQVTRFLLVIPSTPWRTWQWLLGRGAPVKALLILRPCDHVVADPLTVSAAAHFITLTGQKHPVVEKAAKPARTYLQIEEFLNEARAEGESHHVRD